MAELVTLNSEITQASFNITILDDEIREGVECFIIGAFIIDEIDIDVRLPEDSTVVINDDDDFFSDAQSMYPL